MKTILQLLFLYVMILMIPIPLVAQWVQTNCPVTDTTIYSLATYGEFVLAGPVNRGIGIYRSTDNGGSWTEAGSGLNPASLTVMVPGGPRLYGGASYYGLYVSVDSGMNWSALNGEIMLPRSASAYAFLGPYLFVGTDQAVYRSIDSGAHWEGFTGIPNPGAATTFAVIGPNLFAGGCYGGVYLSADSGASWTSVNNGLTHICVRALVVIDSTLFAGDDGEGVFSSTDNGSNWVPASNGLTNLNVRKLIVCDTILIAGTGGGGVFVSNNKGISWSTYNENLGNLVIRSFAIDGTYLYAATQYGGVWRRPLSELTSVEFDLGNIPSKFSLNQNYPNPFNPTTTISFGLPYKTFVSLKVYDLIGREVARLIEGFIAAGNHEVKFHPDGLSSGIYIYRIVAGDFVDTKKLVLLK